MALMEAASLEKSVQWHDDRGVTFTPGFLAGSGWCGFKSKKQDLALIVSDRPASVAGVFTQNLVKASSVAFSQEIVANGTARAIFCSSGNANACVGEQGMVATQGCAALAADKFGCNASEVLVAHTGIIGRPYDLHKAGQGLINLQTASGKHIDDAIALSILTTDTVIKQIAITVRSPFWKGDLHISGVCKGSGMIAPNMATTLCFLTTDACINSPLLQNALTSAMNRSFNRITVDGDTSTNDMALVLANGAGSALIDGGPAFGHFCEALEEISVALAKMVVRDGEGATKLVAITVTGAKTEEDAACVAKTIAESPLVKTALFGNDPNWGRVLAAAGRSGVSFNPNLSQLSFGPHVLFHKGCAALFNADQVHKYLKQSEIVLSLDLHAGSKSATVWTCDYSYDYIRINAEYHT